MSARIILLVSLLAITASCGRVAESRYNPLNWFGRAESTQTGALVPASFRAGQSGPMVAQVTALRIERTSTGGIVSAEGVTPALGYWDAQLVEVPSDDPAIKTYQFRMLPPPAVTIIGTTEQRKVNVGAVLSNFELEQIRQVRVQSASNTLTTRR